MTAPPDLRSHIAELLRRNWNPIPEGAPAQSAYVAKVHEMVTRGASERDIARYLVSVETGILGFQDTDPSSLIPLAKKLRKLTRTIGN